uniref:G-protein coupled receptor 4-like n=1 Tax=Callorhinchus milii TaxID=7868 RepID=A0A4W3HME6_CALMI|eukprot:gi/632990718/ref/XP_007884297.1/ PREDICTED: G-protein coupled receptor 4-like [Callorhinchus milii]
MNLTSQSCGIDFISNKDQLVAINSLTFIVSFTVNCLTLWPVVKQVQQRNILAIYLLSLSLSDLFYVLTLPLWILYVSRGHSWTLGRSSCYFAGFVFYSNMYISIGLLCLVSADRYLAVVYPIRSKRLRRPKMAAWLSLLVVLSVFCFHLPIFVVSIVKDLHNSSEISTCFEHIPLYSSITYVNYARVALGFLLPLLIMIFCYQRVLRGVRKSDTLHGEQKKKVRRLSFTVIIIFSICFAPYHLLLLVRTLNYSLRDDSCPFERQIYFYFNLSLALASFNSAVDPVLYVLVSESVKRDIRKSLISLSSVLPSKSASIGSRGNHFRTPTSS